jgi:hypothetical protein
MHGALRPGGVLHLNTRWWERYRKSRERFAAFSAKSIGSERVIWLNVRHYPKRLEDPHLIEVVMISAGNDGATSTRSFPVTYYPFRFAKLRGRLKAGGFTQVQTTFPSDEWYAVTAIRPT